MSFLVHLFEIVLEASWQSALIVLLILIVRPLIGSSIPACWRHLLWGLVIIRLLVPISSLPSSPVSMQNIAAVNQPLAQAESVLPQFHDIQPSPGLVIQGSETPVSPAALLASPYTPPLSVSWWSVAAMIWFIGVVLGLVFMICAQVRIRERIRLKSTSVDSEVFDTWTQCCLRLGVKRGPVLRLSNEVNSPALVGLIRPILLLPERTQTVLLPVDYENIFLHELAHFLRRDHWTHALELVALSIHWFNPVVWLGFRQLRADRELATDEWALEHLEPERTTGYGSTLLKVLTESSRKKLSAASVGILEDRVQLKHRLQRIAAFSPNKLLSSIFGVSLLAIFGAITLTGSIVQKPTDVPVTVALGPQEILIQSIDQDDPAMAAKALKDGAQVNLETEYIRRGTIDKNTPLYFAAEKGEFDLVKLFVEHGANVQPGKSTWTNPLEAALRNGFWNPVADFLHDHGAVSDPLVYAAGTGNTEGLTKLIAAGKTGTFDEAACAAAGCGQETALALLLGKGANAAKAFQRAASTGSIESMRYLSSHGVDIQAVGYEALCHAAYNDQMKATAFLLQAGVNPNRQKQTSDSRFTEINPPLNQAASVSAVGVVKLLLEAGADPNSVIVTEPGMGNAGNTPLCNACDSDNPEIVQLLLDHGGGMETVTSGGFTPALYAAYYHAPRCLALLLDRRANAKAWNPKWKCGLLDFAVIFNGEDAKREGFEVPTASSLNQCMATVQVLLDHGMDINSTGRSGYSLLSAAIINGQSAWTEMLLQRGAKLNTMDKFGGTPLIRAVMSMDMVKEKRYYAVLDELLARGADVNLGIDNPISEKDGVPSALKAAVGGFGTTEILRKTVNTLLAHGARFSVAKDSDAENMLLAATRGDSDDIARMLKKGISPNVVDNKGWTPLLSATALRYDTIFKMLVDAGADVNAHDATGVNAEWFAMQRYPDLTNFHLLLDKGVNINADADFIFYDPPIYTAIEQHDPVLLSDLLKHGANPNMLPGDHPNRFEPLELAVNQLMEKFADQKRRDVVTMLIAAGANRNPKQEGNRGSLLYFPVGNDMFDMAKFLIGAGIDPKKDVDGGKSVSDESERHGSKEMKSLISAALAKP